MENKLKKLFDYQRFEKNPELERMISEAENKNGARELSDDELDTVYAAGDVELSKTEKIKLVGTGWKTPNDNPPIPRDDE